MDYHSKVSYLNQKSYSYFIYDFRCLKEFMKFFKKRFKIMTHKITVHPLLKKVLEMNYIWSL